MSSKAGPSTKETALFYSILKHHKDKNIAGAVDWDAVAEDTGYNTGATARVRFGQIRRAMDKDREGASGDDKPASADKSATSDKAPAPKAKGKAKASVKADKTSKVTKAKKAATPKKEPATKKTPKKAAKGKAAVVKKDADETEDEAMDDLADGPEQASEAHEGEDMN